MSHITILPSNEGQTQDLLESPMTPSETAQKLQLEARSRAAAADKFEQQRIMADCLLKIYQDRLFRGEQGGRGWGDYLKNEISLLGYGELSTDSAASELNWCVLCNAIDEWNEANPGKQLGYPKGRSYMDGWTTLFDRHEVKGGGSGYMPFSDNPAEAALKTWKTACFKLGEKGATPSWNEARAIGRAARDKGLGRATSYITSTSYTSQARGPRASASGDDVPTQPEPEVVPRTVSPEVLEQARAAREAREAARLDPRDIERLSKHDPIPMNEAETYCGIISRLQMEAQSLRVWVERCLDLYGTEGMEALRNGIDLGIFDVSDDIHRITAIRQDIERTLDYLTDDFEPGCFSATRFEAEPAI